MWLLLFSAARISFHPTAWFFIHSTGSLRPSASLFASCRHWLSGNGRVRAPPSFLLQVDPFLGGWRAFPWLLLHFQATRRTLWRTWSELRASPVIGNGGLLRLPEFPRSSFTRDCGGAPGFSQTWNFMNFGIPVSRPARSAVSEPSIWACCSTA